MKLISAVMYSRSEVPGMKDKISLVKVKHSANEAVMCQLMDNNIRLIRYADLLLNAYGDIGLTIKAGKICMWK